MSENELQLAVPKDLTIADNDGSGTEPTASQEAPSPSDEVQPANAEYEATPAALHTHISHPEEIMESETGDNSSAPIRKSRYQSDLMKASYLHCPFVWQRDLTIMSFNDHDIDLLCSVEEMFDEVGFRFRRFIVNLILCYHNFYRRNIKDCMKHLEELENMMKNSSKRESHDYLFNVINDALYHVVHSCRVYILQTTEQKPRADLILNKIKSYDALDNANQAGIWAIRANVYVEYGYEGVKSAVYYMGEAVRIDPENAFWHFMKGMFIGRLRRMEGGLVIPTNEEFEALNMAIQIRRDPAFLAFAAEAYSETCKLTKKLSFNEKKKPDKNTEKAMAAHWNDLNDVAAKYFKASVELKPNSSHLLFRCGKGLINLPPPYRDVKLGLDFIRRGLESSPNSGFGNHAMAMYLEKIEKDPVRAKEYLNVSVQRKNFQAHVDLIRIEFSESKNAEGLFENLKELLDVYVDMPKRRKILAELICYYLFVAYDLVEACFYMRKLILVNSKSVDVINNHKSMILPVSSPIPLSDLILNRIQSSFNDNKLPDLDREVFKKYVHFLVEQDITPNKISNFAFKKLKEQIELAHKNQKVKVADERERHAQKRVHGAHEFEDDPCREEQPDYLNFYKDDLKEANVGDQPAGESIDIMEMFHQMRSALPKRRSREEEPRSSSPPLSKGRQPEKEADRDGRRHNDQKTGAEDRRGRNRSPELARGSRGHHRRRLRSYSTRSSSRSSSSLDRYSRKSHRHRRRRSPSYSSSSSSSSGSSSFSDDHRRYGRRGGGGRHHRSKSKSSLSDSSSSYDSKRSYRKKRSSHQRRDSSSGTKNKCQKMGRRHRDRSFTSPSSSSRSSVRSNSTLREQRASAKVSDEKNTKHGLQQDTANDPMAAINTSISQLSVADAQKVTSSRPLSPQQKAGPASEKAAADAASTSSQVNDSSASGVARSSKQTEATAPHSPERPSRKRREDREISPGSERSVRSVTSRAAVAAAATNSQPSSGRRSRDRSVESDERSVRTNASRSSRRKEGKSFRRRRETCSSSSGTSRSSSSGDSSSDRSTRRGYKRHEQRRSKSSDRSYRSDRAASGRAEKGAEKRSAGSPRRKHGSGRKQVDGSADGDRSSGDRYSSKKDRAQHGRRRRHDSSGSGNDSAATVGRKGRGTEKSKKSDRHLRSASEESRRSRKAN